MPDNGEEGIACIKSARLVRCEAERYLHDARMGGNTYMRVWIRSEQLIQSLLYPDSLLPGRFLILRIPQLVMLAESLLKPKAREVLCNDSLIPPLVACMDAYRFSPMFLDRGREGIKEDI